MKGDAEGAILIVIVIGLLIYMSLSFQYSELLEKDREFCKANNFDIADCETLGFGGTIECYCKNIDGNNITEIRKIDHIDGKSYFKEGL